MERCLFSSTLSLLATRFIAPTTVRSPCRLGRIHRACDKPILSANHATSFPSQCSHILLPKCTRRSSAIQALMRPFHTILASTHIASFAYFASFSHRRIPSIVPLSFSLSLHHVTSPSLHLFLPFSTCIVHFLVFRISHSSILSHILHTFLTLTLIPSPLCLS